ncbi:hypothetical protein [Streptomyces sp. WAC06614]|uniref:LppU/SCO3897 family protein n=1 Tax=Streptomyces sp. WAC06614 TaxID=2487416 RepID=UPI000F7690BB|nr:hypothetical protein [Streptomyces sp. WAC06614]RSS79139.1 hypothetical protein EF918_18340 [Streptomyces sp. WAC06614]
MSTPPQPQDGTGDAAPRTPAPEAAAAPAPARPKGGKAGRIGKIVAFVLAAALVKFGISYFVNAPVRAEVGDCVQVTGKDNDPKVETKKCDDKDANYKVLKVVENSFDTEACTVGEAALAQQWESEKFVLCLDPVKK